MSWYQFLPQVLVNGLFTGAIYAILCLGLAVVWNTTRVLNLAHGAFVVLGAIAVTAWYRFLPGNPFFSLLVIIPVFFVLGIAVERWLIQPLRQAPPKQFMVSVILVTFGLLLVIQDLGTFVTSLYGSSVQSVPYLTTLYVLGPVTVNTLELGALAAAFVTVGGTWLYANRSQTGKAMQAVSQNLSLARTIGIDIGLVSRLAFGMGIVLAALAGLFIATRQSLQPADALAYTVKALVILLLGGLSSFAAPIIGGLALGVLESLVAFYIGSQWVTPGSVFLLLLILIAWPGRVNDE